MKSRHITFLVLMCLLTTAGVAQVSAQNYKIKQVSTMMGQKMESTVYVKAPRKRTEGGGIMGIGANVATIEQCDLKQTVKLNDKRKIYTVEPFAMPSDEASPAPSSRPRPQPQEKAEKGGTMTMTSKIIDTGERKQMFGFNARHIKTSMKMESSPDACSQVNMEVDTDGWYIDLPQFSCPVNASADIPPQYDKPTRSGCRDKVVVRSSGGGKLGFPLMETQTMNGGQGQSFTRSMETVELSRATLDDALFEIPANYKLADNDQAIYKPDLGEMRKAAEEAKKNGSGGETSMLDPSTFGQSGAKRPGVKRIGVLVPTNGTSENVSTGELRAILTQQLGSGNVEAVAINNAADARGAGCDYVLSSSVTRLKQSTAGKIGGFLGKVTNTDTSQSSTWDIQIDFNLTTVDGQSVLSKSVNDKVKGSVEMASSSVLSKEAAAVRSAIR